MADTTSVAVIGGGLAGRAAACAIAAEGYGVVHVAPAGPPDQRTSALMMPSVTFLEKAGLIAAPESLGHPLAAIRIIDATRRFPRAPETLFEAREAGLDAFGWNFANQGLSDAFAAAARGLDALETRETSLSEARYIEGRWHLRLADGSHLIADLLVGADGKGSAVREAAGITVREHRLAQSALVCDLELTRPIGATSVEFHYRNGPFTLVPAGDTRANLVWIDAPDILARAKGDPAVLADALAEKSMRLFGSIAPVTSPAVFPLSDLKVSTMGARAAALVGESGHAFPPIGAQGLNLGLRDVSSLVDCLGKAPAPTADAHWARRVAEDYARVRRLDVGRTTGMVQSLFGSLVSASAPGQMMRAGGLLALRSSATLRRRAMALGIGRG